jgi:hypothetical protein
VADEILGAIDGIHKECEFGGADRLQQRRIPVGSFFSHYQRARKNRQ